MSKMPRILVARASALQLLAIAFSISVLIVVAKWLSPYELGVWYNYLAIQSFIMMLDFGFSPTFARNFTYAWKGVTRISPNGVAESPKNSVNGLLFGNIWLISKLVYLFLAFLAVVFLCIFYLLYLKFLVDTSDGAPLLNSWIIFSVGATLNIYYLFINSILRGVDKVYVLYLSNARAKFFQLISTVAFLYFGFGLLGVSLGYLLSVIVLRISMRCEIPRNIDQYEIKISALLKRKIRVRTYMLLSRLKAAIGKQTYLTVLSYSIDKTAIFYITASVGVIEAGRYGLTFQVLSVISMFSNVPYNMTYPNFVAQITSGAHSEAYRIFVKSLSFQVYLLCGLGLLYVALGPEILTFISAENEFLPRIDIVLMLICFMLWNIQLICVNCISATNKYPMVYSYLANSVLLHFVFLIMVLSDEVSVTNVISVQILLILLLNFYRWINAALKLMNKDMKTFLCEIWWGRPKYDR